MPRPIFDIEQYELRGIKPDTFTLGQYKELNRSIGRAHGQIDWTAQLLGYNGPNYWGTSGFKADGTFVWTGLPETMAEKRQMQASTYGVFGKDRSYEQWPAPFNRSKILASGDHSFHIFERDNKTLIAPWGLGEECDLFYDATVFVGAVYIFDGEIEVYNPNDTVGLVKTETFSEGEVLWTRMYILDVIVDDIGVKKKGSEAEYFYFKVKTWQDISDWNQKSIASQFLGVWGNKGASVSLDAQFDALNLHGFSEKLHLEGLDDGNRSFTTEDLFESIGARTTLWTAYHNQNFGFKINGSDIFYPIPQGDFESIEFYNFEDCDVRITVKQLIEEDVPGEIDCCNVDNEIFTKFSGAYIGPDAVNNEEYDPFNPVIPEYCVNAIDNGTTVTGDPPGADLYCGSMEGDIDEDRPKGIGAFELIIESKTDCGPDKLCLEWVFSSEMDNGTYDVKYDWPDDEDDRHASCCLVDNEETPPAYSGPNSVNSELFDGTLINGEPTNCDEAIVGGDYPETYSCDPDDVANKMPSDDPRILGPWITFDDGEYDEQPFPNENMGINSACAYGDFLSFDDGFYDEPREPNCDVPERCEVLDGDEIWTYAYFPDYDDCECSTECCSVDNFSYIEMQGYIGPIIVDGGIREIGCCVSDNGIMGPGPFEGEWNVSPNYADCGPDSGVNSYYCCDALDNEDYIYTESPYYGPNNINGCTMLSRISGIKYYQPPPIVPEDFDWPPEYSDNGVLGEDEYDLDSEDPVCLPLYCKIDNESFKDLGKYISYSVDNCTMTNSGSVNDNCIEFAPERPPAPPIPDVIEYKTFETFIEECASCWEECTSCEVPDLCPVDDVYVKVNLKREILYKMHPGLENALTPLRLWKAPTMNVTDKVRNHDTERYNFLIADENRGPNPEDSYRSYVRLPLEYQRNGREWSKAVTICDNMLYWSSTSDAAKIHDVKLASPEITLYEEAVGKDFSDSSILYFEDYLYSNIYEDSSGSSPPPGYVESSITYETPSSNEFNSFTITEYNPLQLRVAQTNGEWRGNYYRYSATPARLSGQISNDLNKNILEMVLEGDGPIYDASQIKYPLTHFPEADDKQIIKNYVVSYAYFAADFSASDEPIFDPEQEYCHRDPVGTCSTVGRDGECILTTYQNKSNYLLHPVA